jgi:hypothetical protein
MNGLGGIGQFDGHTFLKFSRRKQIIPEISLQKEHFLIYVFLSTTYHSEETGWDGQIFGNYLYYICRTHAEKSELNFQFFFNVALTQI